MITYELTAHEESCHVFKTKDGMMLEYLEVPLRLVIPIKTAMEVGTDVLQDSICFALDNLVKKLSEENS